MVNLSSKKYKNKINEKSTGQVYLRGNTSIRGLYLSIHKTIYTNSESPMVFLSFSNPLDNFLSKKYHPE